MLCVTTQLSMMPKFVLSFCIAYISFFFYSDIVNS